MTTPIMSDSVTHVAALSDWGDVLRSHESWLRRILYNRLQNQDLVDDALQEVGLALSRPDLRPTHTDKIEPWLYRVAIKQAYQIRRKLGRRRKFTATLETQTLPETNNDPLDWLLNREREQSVRTALQGLNELDREILLLKYGENWTYQQIADRLGVTFNTVEHRLIQAKKRLRKALLQEKIDV